MINGLLFALTLIAALGSGLVGGVFFAFSAFVMKGLARLPPAQGIAAMQSINLVAPNRWFMPPFFGTAAACLLLTISSLWRLSEPEAIFRVIGSGFYLVGAVAVTIAFNVPRNNALAAVDAKSTDAATRWAAYVSQWTAWNSVRMAAALVATALFIGALAD